MFKSDGGADIARVLIPGWDAGRPAEWANDKKEQVKHLKGWVFSAVRAITRGVTSVPLRFYLVREDGTEEEAPFSHPIRELFRKVNPDMTFRDLIDMTFVHLELTGDAYWSLSRATPTGPPVAIWPLPSQYVKIVPGEDNFVDHYEFKGENTEVKLYKRDDVIHFRYASPNDLYYGYSPLQAAAEAVDADESISFSQYRMFRFGLHPDQIIITLPDKLSRVEKKRMSKELQIAYGGRDKASRLFIQDSGVTINRDFIKPREMDYLDSSTTMRRKILGVYGVPEILVGITEDANRSSATASEYVFSRYTIQPKLEYLDGVITEVLCPMFDPNLKAEFDSPVPKDEEKRTKAVVEQWDSGILTRDEARDELGYDPLGGDQGEELKPQRGGTVEMSLAAPTETVKQEEPAAAEVDALLEAIWDREAESVKFTEVMLPDVTEAMVRGAGLEKRRIEKQVIEEFPEWTRALAEWSRVRWDETIGETTIKGLKETLAEGLAAGDTGPMMAARVRKLFDETYVGRATTIARTEIVSAANAGATMAGKQAGMEKKRWIATLDEHTRDDHEAADGQVVGINETFNVGGVSLRYPGDPEATDPSQTINCRCAVSTISGEEKAYYEGIEKVFRAFEWKLERKTEQDVARYFRDAGERTAEAVLAHYAKERAGE